MLNVWRNKKKKVGKPIGIPSGRDAPNKMGTKTFIQCIYAVFQKKKKLLFSCKKNPSMWIISILSCLLQRMDSHEIRLKRCGVRFSPAAVIILYTHGTSGKTHRRTMPLRNFNKNSGITRVAQELKTNPRHKKYLASMPIQQLEKLIAILRDKLKGVSLEESLVKNKGLDTVDPEEDLNKVDEVTLKRKKAIMDQMFEAHQKKPGEDGFQYDIEVDFEGGAIESCDWDSGKESDNEF